MDNVTPHARVTVESTTAPGKLIAWACRYDPFRSSLLDALRRRKGGPYDEIISLIVMDALDLILKTEGLLPADAPLFSEIGFPRRKKERAS